MITLAEILVHGLDLAVVTGQECQVDEQLSSSW